MANNIKFEIKEYIGVISKKNKGWQKELNIVAWGDNEPKYDIREWDEDHERMGKGCTFTKEEIETLAKIIISNE